MATSGQCLLVVLLLGCVQLALGQALNCQTQTFATSASGATSVAISFELAMAGIPSFGPEMGEVSFYSWSAATGVWQFDGTFAGESAGDQFGAAVAIRADSGLAFVGAPGAFGGAGAVYEFSMSNTTRKWAPTGFVVQGEAAGDSFGAAVSTTDDVAVFGAPNAASGAGKVYMFQRSATTSPWQMLNQFTGAAPGANLGFSVNMAHSGSNCAVGAPSVDGSLAGEASIYCRTVENGTFSLCMDTTSWNPTPGDLYGYSVGAFADYVDWIETGLFVGSPGESLVYMYNSWYGDYTYNATITAPSPGGIWGHSVAVDTTFNGGMVLPLVGAPLDTSGDGDLAYASALIFEGGYWGSPFVPGPELPNYDGTFGTAVAISRGTALVATDSSITFWCTGVDY